MRAKSFPSGLVGLPLIKVSVFAPPPAFSPLKKNNTPPNPQAAAKPTKPPWPSKVKDLDEGRLSSFGFPGDKDAFSQCVWAAYGPLLLLGF